MKPLTAVLAALALMAPAVADAKPARAEGVDTFTAAKSSAWTSAANWSLGHKPNSATPTVIPPNRAASITRAGAETGDLTIEGTLTGTQTPRVDGALEASAGTFSFGGASMTIEGVGTINTGANVPEYLRLQGIHKLTAPLAVGEDLDLEPHASLNAETFDITVPREWYSYLFSSTVGGTGTWRVGELFQYAGPWDEGQEAQWEDATVIVNRPHVVEPTGTSSYACICGWTYRALTLGGYAERTYGAGITMNASGGHVLEAFTLAPEPGTSLALDAGSEVTAGSLATTGTTTVPARVESTEAGVYYTLRIPHDETLEGCVAFSDAHVVGGTLTDACEGDDGGNAGIVF